MCYDRLVFLSFYLDLEDGGSNPPQGTERNGSVSLKKERSGRVGKIALSHSSQLLQTTATSADALVLFEALFSCVNRLINHRLTV
jgi:hypothetical protein